MDDTNDKGNSVDIDDDANKRSDRLTRQASNFDADTVNLDIFHSRASTIVTF
jgi:hypothetical protein